MRGGDSCCMALLAVAACGSDARQPGASLSDAREPGALLSGELIGRAGSEPFPVQYGHLDDWDGDWGARLGFTDVPVTCDGSYVGDRFPDFSAWIEMDMDPQSDEDWDGPYMIMRFGRDDQTRVELEFDSGQLHLDRVDEDSVSGHVSWGGPDETSGEVFTLEGTFEVERCYREYPGD